MLIVVVGLIALAVLAILFFFVRRIHRFARSTTYRLPTESFGFRNVPAIPIHIEDTIKTGVNLFARSQATHTAKFNLSNNYTINNKTNTAHELMFSKTHGDFSYTMSLDLQKKLLQTGIKAIASKKLAMKSLMKMQNKLEGFDTDNPEVRLALKYLTKVFQSKENKVKDPSVLNTPLDFPDQYKMSLTKYLNINKDSLRQVNIWVSTLTNVNAANRAFWPTIANYGGAYNLIILKKITKKNLSTIKENHSKIWTDEMDILSRKGLLYVIDMTLFKNSDSNKVNGTDRFTPTTITFLKQDSKTKKMTPFAISVSGYKGAGAQHYQLGQCTSGTWLYALQAAKTSISVYGIWVGHVYKFHIVTAAMQMAMLNTIPKQHSIYQLLAPYSKHLIGFDAVLLLAWKHVAPPTSFTTANSFLSLIDEYAKDRTFFDDDPNVRLNNKGIKKEDFTNKKDWDQFNLVRIELQFWKATKTFVKTFVDETYSSDKEVQNDSALQKWIKESSSPSGGNLKGLKMNSKKDLIAVLTSFIFRVTYHGISRVVETLNPALSFIPNFPPCLQRADIPDPKTELNTNELLTYMPYTRTIGEMVNFYYIFSFSAPYETAVPLEGIEKKLFFNNGDPKDRRNLALIKYRKFLEKFIIEEFSEVSVVQWPTSIET